MRGWLTEFVTVFIYSRKMQAAFWFGIIAFFIIHAIGWWFLDYADEQIKVEAFRELAINKIGKKYDKAALFFLISSWMLCFKLFYKERHRIFS
ncbi:hypothetical protein LZS94_18250 [Aliivibrio fischeri]|uniref:hypothetical protein n=1 Tax=Aliivibrio fischeri TaxID=668 RepID=UPI0012D9D7DA|nr:hypothetical protein [Aliivibrio fischeri]MCE7579461.1 hypothetical protein [Aliivibrio fischeri]MCE7591750.1 hypothetical protein [Aliivibrio fischeri]MUH98442.1 hypothetical protein [Aliivibrio fischeri]MUI65949.1 hypothetical protein [Aliivibrio fischeri]